MVRQDNNEDHINYSVNRPQDFTKNDERVDD